MHDNITIVAGLGAEVGYIHKASFTFELIKHHDRVQFLSTTGESSCSNPPNPQMLPKNTNRSPFYKLQDSQLHRKLEIDIRRCILSCLSGSGSRGPSSGPRGPSSGPRGPSTWISSIAVGSS